mmetsp:Transcript_2933/g.6429  ORF Transcript_2933/g.6429 Transcript_2933/m.6429 type:complete len:88 (-) Transcript_2933:214-477(-)
MRLLRATTNIHDQGVACRYRAAAGGGVCGVDFLHSRGGTVLSHHIVLTEEGPYSLCVPCLRRKDLRYVTLWVVEAGGAWHLHKHRTC